MLYIYLGECNAVDNYPTFCPSWKSYGFCRYTWVQENCKKTCTCGGTDISPVNCIWTPWSHWGPCSEYCGGGIKKATRGKWIQESNGGTCSGSREKKKSCNKHPCTGEISFTFSRRNYAKNST